MRDQNQIVTFVLGMAAVMVMFALLVFLGPGVIPSQLDKCWVELKKQEPNCASRTSNGATYIRDSRCIRAVKGIQLTVVDDSGWYRVAKLPDNQPVESRTRPETTSDPKD